MIKYWISILIVGMTFGTAWAIRGQFGHEQGAAWAGGIGALALVLVSRRRDWYSKMLLIALSSAIGWGAGGMISYGMVVGYGRSTDLLNASYGLLMLFVIGALFGLLGGGFVGLTLEASKQKRVNWGCLLAEMAAGGVIFYSFLIDQLELLMTPPRSEAWAVCLGAGMAMIWHMARKKYYSPLRVAFYSAIGAGFGFAFGNFLQIVGNVMEIDFNMWNVMEYSIGFFGGCSMAYGVFSSQWAEELPEPKRWENKIAFFVVFIVIPYLVLTNSRLLVPLSKSQAEPPGTDIVTVWGSITAIILIIASVVLGWYKSIRSVKSLGRKEVMLLFIFYWTTYILISYIVTGSFKGLFHLNHHLYVINFMVVFILLDKHYPAFTENPVLSIHGRKWVTLFLAIVIFLFILTLIAINIHGEMGGANRRF